MRRASFSEQTQHTTIRGADDLWQPIWKLYRVKSVDFQNSMPSQGRCLKMFMDNYKVYSKCVCYCPGNKPAKEDHLNYFPPF